MLTTAQLQDRSSSPGQEHLWTQGVRRRLWVSVTSPLPSCVFPSVQGETSLHRKPHRDFLGWVKSAIKA